MQPMSGRGTPGPTQRAPGSFSPLPASTNSTVNALAGADMGLVRPHRPSPGPVRIISASTSTSDDLTPLTIPRPSDQPTAPSPQPGGRPDASGFGGRAGASPERRGGGGGGGTTPTPGRESATPIYSSFTSQSNSASAPSLQTNFSRPTLSTTAALSTARSVAGTHSPIDTAPRNGSSPLTLPPTSATSTTSTSFSGRVGAHSRKHSANAGLFEPTLPSTSTSNLDQIQAESPKLGPTPSQAQRDMSASHIAAQAAVSKSQLTQQQQQPQQQQQQQQQAPPFAHQHFVHLQHRQRSQTIPPSGEHHEQTSVANKRKSGGPMSPPILSLTEASAPRDNVFGSQGNHNGLAGNHTLAATAAANVVFPRSAQSSPKLPAQPTNPLTPTPPPVAAEKPAVKSEKSKVKLFSRPGKSSSKAESSKEKPLPSPGKLGHAFSNLQRANYSTTSLESNMQQPFYAHGNSSTATIRPAEATEKEVKEKEKKHGHFLKRQKEKLIEAYHLPLSSASSNSRPTDPTAPSSLYNFNLPTSPGPSSNAFKSGLDLRHGGRALREKKNKEDKSLDDAASSYNPGGDWPGPSSVSSATGNLASALFHNEPFDSQKFGLNNMTLDDAWPFLRAKLLVIFEAEDLRLPVEDLNRIVTMHIQYCISRRSPNIIIEDIRDFLTTGFSSLDQSLKKTPEDRLIPALVELWIFTFTSILPYLQAVFLPLDMEFAGNGPLMTPDQARDFWGGVPASYGLSISASSVLDIRRLVLLAFRDIVILPRYDTLKIMFSRLSLEFLPQSLASMALSSPVPVPTSGFQNTAHNQGGAYQAALSTSPSQESQLSLSFAGSLPATMTLGMGAGFGTAPPRPNTSMSNPVPNVDPSYASYNSNGMGIAGGGGDTPPGSGNRSRTISNVSFGSDHGNANRPFTPSSIQALGAASAQAAMSTPSGVGIANLNLNMSTPVQQFPLHVAPSIASIGSNSIHGSLRDPSGGGGGRTADQNVEDSKQVTEMVGRMLQCMSVLASVSAPTTPSFTSSIPNQNSHSSTGNLTSYNTYSSSQDSVATTTMTNATVPASPSGSSVAGGLPPLVQTMSSPSQFSSPSSPATPTANSPGPLPPRPSISSLSASLATSGISGGAGNNSLPNTPTAANATTPTTPTAPTNTTASAAAAAAAAGAGGPGGGGTGGYGYVPPDESSRMIEELNKLLKLNWLGRGRTGRNRRGIVGGRVKRARAGSGSGSALAFSMGAGYASSSSYGGGYAGQGGGGGGGGGNGYAGSLGTGPAGVSMNSLGTTGTMGSMMSIGIVGSGFGGGLLQGQQAERDRGGGTGSALGTSASIIAGTTTGTGGGMMSSLPTAGTVGGAGIVGAGAALAGAAGAAGAAMPAAAGSLSNEIVVDN
ncbi:HbrB-like domain-containing protein [Neurospora intermedia]|uniref:HbrB-like domain-containing protein n=1 Tax=Neurospora intermedia TaxID=5142 RepID=A0ABR3DE35_NEUIN